MTGRSASSLLYSWKGVLCACLPGSKTSKGKEMSRQTATALPTGTSKCTPSQRVPALTGTTASNNDLASLFECPVCFDYVLPPILQCQSGHLVCSNCRPKLTCCPTCRGPLGSIRNLAMEKVANSVLFPCKYASSGCEITLPHTEKAEHEELCVIRQPRRLLKDIGPYADCLYVTNLTMNVYGVCVTKERERQKRVRFVFWSLTGTWLNTSNVFRGIH
ncbi:E3 ubiquitin-protein ligase SIAH1 isoform X3 [Aptenodytes patagonicus]|uniref:E3 ubiquitin-protein ligase SIAH1 isoform X3 n=1 Tax=Aptenodytes patagonicus TaxID=9234 RepID=UPI003FA0E0EC